MSQILPPWGRSWAQDKSSRAATIGQGFLGKIQTVDEDSNSTDLSVSGDESHSLILLAHYIFWFQLSTKLLSNAGYAAELHKNA